MPGRRNNRRRSRRKRAFKKSRKPSKHLVKAIKKVLESQLEKKVHIKVDTLAPLLAGDKDDLCEIAQGLTLSGRIGTKITPTKMELTYQVAFDVADDVSASMRVILLKWRNDSSVVTPTSTNLFESGVSLPWRDFWINPSERLDNPFQVLHDRTYRADNTWTTTTSTPTTGTIVGTRRETLPVKVVRRLHGSVDYNGSATTGSHHYYLFAVSDYVSGTPPSCFYTTRLSYTDA